MFTSNSLPARKEMKARMGQLKQSWRCKEIKKEKDSEKKKEGQ